MSDISMPPSPPPPPKKELLANGVVKFILALLGVLAPVPVLIVLIHFWLRIAPPEQTGGVFDIFREMIEGYGNPPFWLLPLAFMPSLLMLTVLFQTRMSRIIAVVVLFLAAFAAAAGLAHMIARWG
jgi:hypothetical protein